MAQVEQKQRGTKRRQVEYEAVFADETEPTFYEDLNGYFQAIGLFD